MSYARVGGVTHIVEKLLMIVIRHVRSYVRPISKDMLEMMLKKEWSCSFIEIVS
jgi:hypothetical protein